MRDSLALIETVRVLDLSLLSVPAELVHECDDDGVTDLLRVRDGVSTDGETSVEGDLFE